MRVTWWGHACVTVELDGVRLLLDPAMTMRLAHLRRVGSLPPPASARRADVVLVSHLHADHLHLPSLRLVDAPTLVVPAGGGALARRAGVREVREVREDDVVEVGGVRVRAVHAEHDGRRLPRSPHAGPALGYVISGAGRRVWFAGDTGRFDAVADIGPVDLALVPIGGWGPTLGDGHLDPEQAAEAVAAVRARHSVPIHFGTFWPIGLRALAPTVFRRMFTEPGRRFVEAAPASTTVHLLACGESLELPDWPASAHGSEPAGD